METFKRYYLDVIFQHYLDFKGRASRSEFWYFVLFNLLVTLVLMLIDNFLINQPLLHMTPEEASRGGILQVVYSLAVFLPTLALSVRRLHDIGKSGWWMLLSFVPIIGPLVLLIFWILPSKESDNPY